MIFARADFVNVVRFHFRRGSRFTITANRTVGRSSARQVVLRRSGYWPRNRCVCIALRPEKIAAPLCGAIISEIRTAITTANSVRFIRPRQGFNHNAPGDWKGNHCPAIRRAEIDVGFFTLRVDGSVVDSRRSLLLVAEVIAVSDFGYFGRECRCRLVRRSKRRCCLRGA
jgi:hypothetical protein